MAIALCSNRLYKQLTQTLNPADLADPDHLTLLEVPIQPELSDQIQIGRGNAASGEASFRFLETAITQTLAGAFEGIVTAPIAKSAWKAAGHDYPGQTELLAQRAGVERFGMLFVAQSPHSGWTLRTLLATTHIPLRQVAESLTPALLTLKLELLLDCLRQDFWPDGSPDCRGWSQPAQRRAGAARARRARLADSLAGVHAAAVSKIASRRASAA